MWELCYYFAIFLLTQHASSSSEPQKVDIAPGIGFQNYATKSSDRQRCDNNFRIHVPYNIDKTFKESSVKAIKKSFDHYITSTCLTFEWVDDINDIPERFDNGTGLYFKPIKPDYPYPVQLYLNSKKKLFAQLRLSETLEFDAMVGRANQQIFYALGYCPEHRRKDRDSYVTLLKDNIEPGSMHDFDIKNDVSTQYPYNYQSVGNFYPSDGAKDPKRSVMTSKTGIPVTKNLELSPPDSFRINAKLCLKC